MPPDLPSRTAYLADSALLPSGWAERVLLTLSDDGRLAAVAADVDEAAAAGAGRLAGPVVPGVANLHSHAFQRAMAGLTERAAGDGVDSFWTWRETMYRFVERLTPEDVEAIAAHLYVEMLKAGYTAVGEFHYLHHQPDGSPYADPAEMAERIVAAAGMAGIGLTLLPVLYARGGFGGAPAGAGQRRFVHGVDGFLALVDRLARRHAEGGVRLGIAPHSLRAVTPDELAAALAGLAAIDPAAPIHIHVAEQEKEVADCLAWSGRRPVEWLLDHAPVDRRWCLVHATHLSGDEVGRLAASGAVAGLCPTTEADLGDGLFPAPAYLAAGGRIGIGSDSHVSLSPFDELRVLEYGQRLARRRRNLLAGPGGGSVGGALVRHAVAGGAQALGQPVGALEAGRRADFVVLDTGLPEMAGRSGDALLDTAVFAASRRPVRDVFVGGRQVVRDGRHDAEAATAARYAAVLRRLLD